MLPLVQMHQMVPNPHLDNLHYHPHFDRLPPFATHIKAEYLALNPNSPRNPRTPTPYASINGAPRAFPIRTSQPAPAVQHRQAASLSHAQGQSDHIQHQLRRKTPNGTIDAGYDGSPAGLAVGPPPLKQLIMPSSSTMYPTAFRQGASQSANPGSHLPVATTGWHCPPQLLMQPQLGGGLDAHLGPPAPSRWISGHPVVPDGLPSLPIPDGVSAFQSHQIPYGRDPRLQAVFTPSYQQTMGPTAFNPAGFTPPPVWKDMGVSDYYGQVSLSNLGFIPQNAAYDAAYMPAQPSMHHPVPLPTGHGLGLSQTMGLGISGYDLDPSLSHQRRLAQSVVQTPNRGLESLSLNTTANIHLHDDGSAPTRFKERVLAHAHKTYADLLMYLSYTKQPHHGKASYSGSRQSSKMVVFPKPPKHMGPALSPQQPSATQGHVIRPNPPNLPFLQSRTALIHGHNHIQVPGARPLRADGLPDASTLDNRIAGAGSTSVAEIFGNPNQPKFAYPGKLYGTGGSANGELSSPLHGARQSLEMLSNLCEQSGWKWVDGMLLGGCLHYGLEHYEEALDWFKRIVDLESNHVEAISNIAATLYCLNKPEEAEQHWRQAVSARPSYLEAVEHLVGLLCSSQRSREAVEIISQVQQQLRSDESQSSQDGGVSASTSRLPSSSADSASQPGFGSSGYMIPGSENGRMLLLVHAKGNMLYALKNVQSASEAFEEAVMISIGRKIRGVRSLIRNIHAVLSPRDVTAAAGTNSVLETPAPSSPLLLPPERARHTARYVFASTGGHLPGLQSVPEGSHRKSAVSTTSNSLLSLAKIFQDSMSNGGPPPGQSELASGVGDILALYYLSLSLQESPSTANNVGILLASVQHQSSRLEPPSANAAAVARNVPGIIPGSGLALALAYYNYGLTLDNNHVHLHTNLGSLLKDIGQLDMAIRMYERAVECDGTFDIALTNLANAVKDRGRISEAIDYYKRAVSSNPEFAEAVCGLSTALNSVCDWRGRGGVYLYGGTFDRWHIDDKGMFKDVRVHGRGGGLMKRVVDIVGRQLHDASLWGRGILQDPAVLELLVSQLLDAAGAGEGRADDGHQRADLVSGLRQWTGKPWEGSRIVRLLERATRSAMRRWYTDKYLDGEESPSGYPRPRLPGSLTIPSAPTVLPFHTFTCPLTARDIRMISQRNAHRISCSTLRSPWLPGSVYRPPPPPRPHLNVGYVSSDFNNHPLAHLMQSVFGFHDTSRAKAFCYATTASDKSVHRQQIEREAPVFRDVSNWSSEKLVNQIVQDEIHILVNLNGYTRGARNEIFAARPAPIQMSFMGFAGTLGAEWCDYLLADTTAVPPSTLRSWRRNLSLGDVFRDEPDVEKEWVYSENIIYSRDTFFCCDHAQSADAVDESNMSWEDEQRRRWKMRMELFPSMPADAIIFGNFNQLYKIDPTTFRTWLRILAGVPKAYLWLLRFPELGENNLRRTAREWAGEEVVSRIIFTDVAPKQQHISRARVCDLFLDTPECNAHTTAADVLWSSTPLLTLPRYQYKMCSRMAASILKGALPKTDEGDRAASDLIASGEEDYEERAILLGNGVSYRITSEGWGQASGRLSELRKLLWASKWTCGLFDTRRWVGDLEDAYEEAWRRWVAGEGGDIYL